MKKLSVSDYLIYTFAFTITIVLIAQTIGDLYAENHINRIICDFLCDWFCYGLHRPEIPEEEDLEEVYKEIFSDLEIKELSILQEPY